MRSGPANLKTDNLISVEEAVSRKWDAIIVGSGVGGSCAALSLAEKGWKVLVIEKGKISIPGDKLPLWSEPVFDVRSQKSNHPFIGEGVGGSSRLYGMVMEKLEERDYEINGGLWPESPNEWTPWFKKAESIFSVRTSVINPLFDPLKNCFQENGLEFKPLKLAYSGTSADCKFCQSALCEESCKVDAWTGVLSKAMSTGQVFLLTQTEAQSLEHHNGVVRSVRCKNGEEEITLNGEKIILAAGALKTPLLLLKSPNINNVKSFFDLPAIGHYLMRHLIDLYIIRWPAWTKLTSDQKEILRRSKTWGCDTLYEKDGMKLGTIQAFGSLPEFQYVWDEMSKNELRYFHRIPFVKPIMENIVTSLFSSPIATSIIEDGPVFTNHVRMGASGRVEINYEVSTGDAHKVHVMRKILKDVFGKNLHRLESQVFNNFRLAHVCGTARMGHDFQTSVTDAFGKVHFSENLWIADASVFPASTGKNPALIIAAHALRMAHQMILEEGAQR